MVLKIHSPDITHKTDVGGVALDLADADDGARGLRARSCAARGQRGPDARIDGVTVQPMIRAADGLELILGIKKDPVFGTVILAGHGRRGGGAAAATARLGFPPLNERLAQRMLESLRMWPLLTGYRGPAAGRPSTGWSRS